MPTRVDRQLRALQLAKDCAALGGSGSHDQPRHRHAPRALLQLLFPDRQSVPKGRAPDSPEWYHNANLLYRAESSILASLYRRLRDAGFAANEALVGAYRHYLSVCQVPHRISFDRAFDIAAHIDGIWITETRSFSIATCPVCASEHLAAIGTIATSNSACPFCKLVQRYRTDQRVQTSFPAQPLADPTSVQLGMIALLRDAENRADTDSHSQQPLFRQDTGGQ